MKRCAILFLFFLVHGLMVGCAYFQKKDEPPPLPPIEEPKPPLKLKGAYFESFPWDELPKPRKDGNDLNTFVYVAESGDTMEIIAEKTMGDPALSSGLASYNELASPLDVPVGEKIVVPYPIVGVKSQLLVKEKGAKEWSEPRPFDTALTKGDRYKLRFVTNVNGYLYVFRENPKTTTMLFPQPPPPKSKRRKPQRPLAPDPESARVTAREPVIIPPDDDGFLFDLKSAGDRIHVFLSLRKIPDFEDLKIKGKIPIEDVRDVMHRVRVEEIYTEDPLTLIRLSDPKEILGFSLNLGVPGP